VALVVSLNVHRRHLTASQRAAAIVARYEWRPSGKSPPGGDLPPSNAALAKEAGVGTRTIEQAKSAHAAGLGEAVRTGKLSAKDAAEKAKAQESEAEKPVRRSARRRTSAALRANE